MWHSLTSLDISVWEKVLRTVAVYLVLTVLLRVAGKRDAAQLSSFDLVVMLLLSNVVQNAIIGPDDSLLGGVIGAVVLITFNAVMTRLGFWRPFGRLFSGTPSVLVRDGAFQDRELWREGISKMQLTSALRLHGVTHTSDLREVSLLPSGALDVELNASAEPATQQGIDDIKQVLLRVEAQLAAG